MKNVLMILITILFLSCDRHERIIRKYFIENGTGREISMDFYSFGSHVKSVTKKGEGLIVEGLADDGGTNDRIDPRTAFNADSIVIIFNKVKKQIYYSSEIYNFHSIPENESRNIFNESSYVIVNEELYRFIFTEEDYENAEDF